MLCCNPIARKSGRASLIMALYIGYTGTLTPHVSLVHIREAPRENTLSTWTSAMSTGASIHAFILFIHSSFKLDLTPPAVCQATSWGLSRNKTTMVPALLEMTVRSCCVVCIKCANGWLDRRVVSSDVRVPRESPQLASPSLSLSPPTLLALQQSDQNCRHTWLDYF